MPEKGKRRRQGGVMCLDKFSTGHVLEEETYKIIFIRDTFVGIQS